MLAYYVDSHFHLYMWEYPDVKGSVLTTQRGLCSIPAAVKIIAGSYTVALHTQCDGKPATGFSACNTSLLSTELSEYFQFLRSQCEKIYKSASAPQLYAERNKPVQKLMSKLYIQFDFYSSIS